MKKEENILNPESDCTVDFEENDVFVKGGYYVSYRTSKFERFIELTGTLIPFHSGRTQDYKFEPDDIQEEYERIYDENWEQVEDDILNGFTEYALSKGGI